MNKTALAATEQAHRQFDPFGFRLHRDVQQDDSALDWGGKAFTWCGRCGAYYNTAAWWQGCSTHAADRRTQNKEQP